MTLSVALTILAVFATGIALILAGWRSRRVALAPAVVETAATPDPAEAISQRIDRWWSNASRTWVFQLARRL